MVAGATVVPAGSAVVPVVSTPDVGGGVDGVVGSVVGVGSGEAVVKVTAGPSSSEPPSLQRSDHQHRHGDRRRGATRHRVPTRARPSCTTVTASVPSEVKMAPPASPRPEPLEMALWSYSNQSSARNGRWNHIA